jgi:hypothetical protein
VIVCVFGISNGDIFLPESLALVLFGFSWLTKGEVGWTVKALKDRVIPPHAAAPGAAPGA